MALVRLALVLATEMRLCIAMDTEIGHPGAQEQPDTSNGVAGCSPLAEANRQAAIDPGCNKAKASASLPRLLGHFVTVLITLLHDRLFRHSNIPISFGHPVAEMKFAFDNGQDWRANEVARTALWADELSARKVATVDQG